MTTNDITCWLRQFRKSTPRDLRQTLIDTVEPSQIVQQLRVQRELGLYLLAAQALQWPERTEERQILARSLNEEDLADVRRFMLALRIDHKKYETAVAVKGALT
jgi:hypothetical protein